MQQGDVYLFNTVDGGDISVNDGITLMTPGLETAVYLSLFGDNTWWGNDSIDDINEMQSSETIKLVNGQPQTTKNLTLMQQANEKDLSWLVGTYANSVSSNVVSESLNRVKINIEISQDSGNLNLTFPLEWSASNGT